MPGGFGHLIEQVTRAEFIGRLAVGHVLGPPVFILLHSAHKVVRYAHRVVGILKKDRGVGFAVDRGIVAGANQSVCFCFFFIFAFDEFHDVRMVHVQNDHLGRATRLAATLDDAREGVETLHEAHGTRSDASAGKSFLTAAQ